MEEEKTFYPGTRVIIFDNLLFKNDRDTPLSTTMKPATVVRWYGERTKYGIYDSLIDVDFDHRGLSEAHFTMNAEILHS